MFNGEDEDGESNCRILNGSATEGGGTSVRENEPYAGTYVPMACQGASAQVTSIMLELRADTHVDTDLRATAGLRDVVAALTRVIDQLSNDDVSEASAG